MRIGQILFADGPFYERKSQAVDAAALAIGHHILPTADGAQLLHVYAPLQFPASRLSGVKVPYVANGRPSDSVFHSRPRQPARNVLPFGAQPVPEAVANEFFDQRITRASPRVRKMIGSLRRSPRDDAIRLATMSRMARFRDDVDWRVFVAPLKPMDLTALDVWVDATEDDRDLDGLGAEAIVAGVPVVATRTPVNKIRLADGRRSQRADSCDPDGVVRDRFRSERRTEKLIEIYEELVA